MSQTVPNCILHFSVLFETILKQINVFVLVLDLLTQRMCVCELALASLTKLNTPLGDVFNTSRLDVCALREA